jgi:WhiB family redox-sensing transcriptional regulator
VTAPKDVVEGEAINLSLPTLRNVMSIDWRNHTNCAKLPKSVFFDYNSKNVSIRERKERTEYAMSVCRDCPVKQQCYEFAVTNCEPHGIWAGTLPDQRKALYKTFTSTGVLETLPAF